MMKSPITIFTLLFTVMFSSTSFADWTKVTEDVDGTTYYVDFERIRKHGGYVYNWMLLDFLKPDTGGHLSSRVYQQIDCGILRGRGLSWTYHKVPMGGSITDPITPEQPKWVYPVPKTAVEIVLKTACSR